LETKEESKRLEQLRDQLETTLIEKYDAVIHGMSTQRLPHISNVYLPHFIGPNLNTALSTRLAVSAGSACSSGEPGGSHVLRAMGLSADAIKKTVRISLGRMTKEEDILRAVETFALISN
jgi:cysteine desulfurase